MQTLVIIFGVTDMSEKSLGYVKPFRIEDTYIIPVDVKWDELFTEKIMFEAVIDEYGRLSFHGPKIVKLTKRGLI